MTEQIEEVTTPQPFAAVGSDGAPDLEAVMHLMWDRIEGLEADKRSLRRMIGGGLATGVLVAAVLGGFLIVHAGASRSARDLAVTDAAGRVRARLGVDSRSGATTLQLM
ncbi:MAG TPA: hypothetical protein VLF14_09500, partial [Candidatus Binatia bacterium]|nr:hypothetical protein [Candidatus Binatia bacterium]